MRANRTIPDPKSALELLNRRACVALLAIVPLLNANAEAQRPQTTFEEVVASLHEMGCSFPQESASSRIPGLIQGKFRQAKASDWACLCQRGQEIKLAVFFSDPEVQAIMMRKSFAGDGAHLQPRKIATVPKKFIIERCDSSLDPIPSIDHDGILDVTAMPVVHYYYQGRWLDFAVVR